MDSSSPSLLFVPGVGDSGPGHWQSIWQAKYPNTHRVAQENWDWPERDDWVSGIDRALDRIAGDVVLVAHSIGCITVAHWAACKHRLIMGALLVAPVDLERPEYPPGVGGFTPTPNSSLPFPSILVCSSNDEYCDLGRGEEFARAWGSRFINIGPAGHINANAGFGDWPGGEALLKELCGL